MALRVNKTAVADFYYTVKYFIRQFSAGGILLNQYVCAQVEVYSQPYLTLKRLSLLTISPSFRHPLLLDLSSTSHSLLSSGSFSRLILVLRSGHSDMASGGGGGGSGGKVQPSTCCFGRCTWQQLLRGQPSYFRDDTERSVTTYNLLFSPPSTAAQLPKIVCARQDLSLWINSGLVQKSARAA